MPSFKRIPTQDKDLQLIQDNIVQAVTPLQSIPMVGGNMLSDVLLTSGQDNKVAHKLGRTPQFFIVSQLNADSRIWQTAADASFITMQCSNSCTASLWVN